MHSDPKNSQRPDVTSSPRASDPETLAPRDSLAIWLLIISAFVLVLNETIMGVALPRLMHDLQITASLGQWLTAAYLLTMSVIIPITGMLIQRVRTKALYVIAMTGFTIGTLICAIAPNFEVLLAGRIVQALGTAVMMPLLFTTVTTTVPKKQRGAMMGRIAIVIAVAPALGPTVSGVILQYLEWRWLFIVVLPIAIATLILGGIFMPNVGEQRKSFIDPLSVILTVVGFGGFVYGLSAFGNAAETELPYPAWLPAVVGLVGIVLFVWRQVVLQKTDRALLDLRTFQTRQFALGVLKYSIFSMALFGSLILLPIYVQDVLHYDTLVAGLVLLPGGLVMGLLGHFVGQRVDRQGSRSVLIPGSIVVAASLGAMGLFDEHTELWFVIAIHVVLSVGLACTFTPLFEVSLGSIPSRLASYGSATISTVGQMAGAAGTALFITIMTVGSVASAGSADSVGAAELADGVRIAFLIAGLTATIAAAIAFFIYDPVDRLETVTGPETAEPVSQ